MSVRTKPKLAQRRYITANQTPSTCSKRKRVSLLPSFTTDLRCLFHYNGDKQRCDGKHPCTLCVKFSGGSNCVYEQNPVTKRIREKLPAAVQPFLFSFKREPSPCGSSSRVNSEDTSLSTSDVASSDIGGFVFSSTDTSSSRVSLEEHRSPESDATDKSDPLTTQERSNSETQLVPFREESPKPHQPQPIAISTFSFLPSLRFPSIPRQLRTPLRFFGPEHLQVSDKTPSELDLSLWVFTFFGCGAQTSRELTPFGKPPFGATTIEIFWDLSHRSQTRRCDAWRHFKHLCSSIFRPRHGCARDASPCWCRKLSHNGPTAREILSTSC